MGTGNFGCKKFFEEITTVIRYSKYPKSTDRKKFNLINCNGEKAIFPCPFCTPDILYQNKFDSEYQV